MSVNSVMGSGLSALIANQTALRSTSQNVANVNTPGYTRVETQFTPNTLAGVGAGVNATVARVTDRFLTEAHQRSISDNGRYQASGSLLDRAQAFLGDPSQGGSLFAGLDNVFNEFASLANDPSSSLRQTNTINALQTAYSDVQRTYNDIDGLRDEADSQISAAIDEANGLMQEIARLNAEISTAMTSGTNPTGAQTEQSQLIDRLAEFVDIRVQQRDLGGVEIRTTSGMLLVDQRASTIQRSAGTPGQRYADLEILPSGAGGAVNFNTQVRSGELRGLMTVRDVELAQIGQQLGEYASGLADVINAAHNEGTAVPAPTNLTGRNTGLLGTDALGFTGAADLAIVDATGTAVQTLAIDFDAGTITSGGATTAFGGTTIADFTTALNTVLGGNGTASFTDGRLSINATGTNGVAIAQDPTTPSDNAGRGFSHFFGLNDVITAYTPAIYETGLSGTAAHGFTNGDTITFAVRNTNGDVVRTVDYAVAGTSINDIINDINSTAVLGGFATASISANGELQITSTSSTSSVDILADETSRGTTGISFSALFGLSSDIRANRARSLDVDDAFIADPGRLATATANLSGAVAGDFVLAPGDGSGASGIATARDQSMSFADTGAMGATVTSISDYAGRIAASAGLLANNAESRSTSSLALMEEASVRRQSIEGVNLDEEMVNMTVYQQGYSAAARLIQAATEMYDTLLNMA